MRWLGAILLITLPGLLALVLIFSLLHQDNANRRFVPVDAVIHSTEIRRHSGKSTTYSPEATYSYRVNGTEHTSTDVLATSNSSSHSWAEDMLSQVQRRGPAGPEGTPAIAYVNPNNPDDAVLVRWYSFIPYIFCMICLFLTMLGFGILIGAVGGGRKEMKALALDDSGWQLLLPRANLRQQYRNSILWLVGTTIAMIPLPAHWTFVAGQTGGRTVFAWLLALGVVGLIAVIAWRRREMARHMSDARLRVRPIPLRRDEAFAIELEADALSPLQIQEITASVTCIEHYKEKRGNKTSYGTRTHREEKVTLAAATQVPAGDILTGKGEVTLTSCPCTSDAAARKQYPWYTWEIRIAVKLEKMVDYAAVFPLEVV